jgi:heme oxygenase
MDHSPDADLICEAEKKTLPDRPRTTIALLRYRTASLHSGLESGLGIIDRLSCPETRGDLIAGYYAFHHLSEQALGRYLGDVPGLEFSTRLRASTILADADHLRLMQPTLPPVASVAEALGALYVLEGSTLGGRTILNSLKRRGVSVEGLSFLDPYGKHAGRYWRTFLQVLERETASDRSAMNQCAAGAITTFAFAEICLREERTK